MISTPTKTPIVKTDARLSPLTEDGDWAPWLGTLFFTYFSKQE